MNTDAVVLAGGKSSRLMRDKRLETVGDRSLLQRVINIVNSVSSDIFIVNANGQSFPHLRESKKLRIVTDIYPDGGALGGLYTGLVASNSFYNLVVASDMPFLNYSLLRYMIHIAEGYDAVVPRLGDRLEPLHAVYTKRCLIPMERKLERGDLKIQKIYPLIRVRYLEAREIKRFDPEYLSLFNVNTETDLAKARKLAERGGEYFCEERSV
ncbi:MAG: molybdenum cofactor guanylyltransferase [Candidatus Aminicenantes bacterium]|jgi:molybdopterin-guanine dinucleotide biosynthesis protein A